MPPEKNKGRNSRVKATEPCPKGPAVKTKSSNTKKTNNTKPDQMEEDKEKRDDDDAVIEAATLDTTAVEQCYDVKKCFEQDPESTMMMQKEYKKLAGDDEDCHGHQDHPLIQEALARIYCKMPKTQAAPDTSQLQFVAQNNVPVHDILVIIADIVQQKQKAIGLLEEAVVNELLTVISRLAHTPPKNPFTVKKKMTESTIESACWWCANVTLGSWYAKENKHKRQKKDNAVKSKDIRNFINKTNGADDTSNGQDQEEEKAGGDNDDGKANEPLQTPAKGKGTNRTDVESPQFQLSPKTKQKVNAEVVAKKRQHRSRFSVMINIPDLTKTNKSATDHTIGTVKSLFNEWKETDDQAAVSPWKKADLLKKEPITEVKSFPARIGELKAMTSNVRPQKNKSVHLNVHLAHDYPKIHFSSLGGSDNTEWFDDNDAGSFPACAEDSDDVVKVGVFLYATQAVDKDRIHDLIEKWDKHFHPNANRRSPCGVRFTKNKDAEEIAKNAKGDNLNNWKINGIQMLSLESDRQIGEEVSKLALAAFNNRKF